MNPKAANAVLDASALLAHILSEKGQNAVDVILSSSVISVVNWSEVVAKLLDYDWTANQIMEQKNDYDKSGLSFVDFTATMADSAGLLRAQTKKYGLSLGDRSCLALGMIYGCPVVTADKKWKSLEELIAVEINCFR